MGLKDRITGALSGDDDQEGAQYACDRCGAEYDRLRTPCEECGSDVMTPLD